MKIIQIICCLLLIVGSFMPLVHLPFIGNWNYWGMHQGLAIGAWVGMFFTLLSIVFDKRKWVLFFAFLLLVLFSLSIIGIKNEVASFFRFMPLSNWQTKAFSFVHLGWGWYLEYAGVLLLIFLNLIPTIKEYQP